MKKLFLLSLCLLLSAGISILKAETATFSSYSNVQVSTANLNSLGLLVIKAGTFNNGTLQTSSSYAQIAVHASTGKYQTSNNTPYAGFYTVTNVTAATALGDGQIWGYNGSAFNTYYAKVSGYGWKQTTTPYNILACTMRIQKNSSGNIYINYNGTSYNNSGNTNSGTLALTIGSGTVYTLNNATGTATDVIVGGGSVTVNAANTIFESYTNTDGYSARISVATTSTGNFSASQFNGHNMSTWLKKDGNIIEINDIRGSITTVNGIKYFDVELVDYEGHKYHVTNIKQLESGVITATCNPSYGTVSGIVLDDNTEFESGIEYPAGTTIKFTAQPIKGYMFTSWNDDNLNNPRTIIVDGPQSLVAQFEQGVNVSLEEGTASGGSDWCQVSGSNADYEFCFYFTEKFTSGSKNYSTMNRNTSKSWVRANGGEKKAIQTGYTVSIDYNSIFRRAVLIAQFFDSDGLKYKVSIITNKLGSAYLYDDVENTGKTQMGNGAITFSYSEVEGFEKTDTYLYIYVNRSVPDDYGNTSYQTALLFNISGDQISGVYPIRGTANPGTMTVGGYNSNDGLAGSWGYFDDCKMLELGTGKWLFRSGEVTLRWKDASHYYIEVNAYGSTGNNVRYKIGNLSDAIVNRTVTLTQPAHGTLTVRNGENIVSFNAQNQATIAEGTTLTVTYSGNGYDASISPTLNSSNQFVVWGDVAISAQVSRHNYSITYTGLNGTTNSSNPLTYNIEDDDINLSSPGIRTGYTFTNWTDDDNNNAIVTQIVGGTTGDRHFTANWSANPYLVYFSTETEGCSVTGAIKNGDPITSGNNQYYDTELTFTSSAATGYEIDYWTSGGSKITGSDGHTSIDFTVTDNTTTNTIKAVYKKKVYTITWLDGNGNELTTTQVEHGSTPAYTGSNPTKSATTGYTYEFNDTWSPSIVDATEAATYTAQFNAVANTYNITLDKGDGTNDGSATVKYNGTALEDGRTDATKTGNWSLKGYYTATSEGTKVINNDGTFEAGVSGYTDDNRKWINTTENVKLYAQWQENDYTVTFTAGDHGTVAATAGNSEIESEASVAAGTAVTVTATAKNFYHFKEWRNGSNEVVNDANTNGNTYAVSSLAGDVNLTAVFERDEVIVLTDNHTADEAWYNDYAKLVEDVTAADAKVTVRYERDMKANTWCVFALPFEYSLRSTSSVLKGKVYKLGEVLYTTNEGMTLNFPPVEKNIKANVPYLFYSSSPASNLVFENVALQPIGDGSYEVENSGDIANSSVVFHNTEAMTQLDEGKTEAEKKKTIYLSGNRLYYLSLNNASWMRAFRGYFELHTNDLRYIQPRVRIVLGGETATEIDLVDPDNSGNSGVRKYMENGILVIEREGIRYDATGAKIN